MHISMMKSKDHTSKQNYSRWKDLEEWNETQQYCYFKMLIDTAFARTDRAYDANRYQDKDHEWMSHIPEEIKKKHTKANGWMAKEAIEWVLAKKNKKLNVAFEFHLQTTCGESCYQLEYLTDEQKKELDKLDRDGQHAWFEEDSRKFEREHFGWEK